MKTVILNFVFLLGLHAQTALAFDVQNCVNNLQYFNGISCSDCPDNQQPVQVYAQSATSEFDPSNCGSCDAETVGHFCEVDTTTVKTHGFCCHKEGFMYFTDIANCAQDYLSNWHSLEPGGTPCNQCHYSQRKVDKFCQNCPAGEFLLTGAVCTACKAGRYSTRTYQFKIDVSLLECSACPRGKYSAASSTECLYCPLGKYVNNSGAEQCKNCPNGKYGNEFSPEPTLCNPCPAGKYSGIAAKVCSDCPAGKFSSAAEQNTCKNCLVGQFTNEVSQSQCKICAAGQFADLEGQGTCKSCPVGKFSVDKLIRGTMIGSYISDQHRDKTDVLGFFANEVHPQNSGWGLYVFALLDGTLLKMTAKYLDINDSTSPIKDTFEFSRFNYKQQYREGINGNDVNSGTIILQAWQEASETIVAAPGQPQVDGRITQHDIPVATSRVETGYGVDTIKIIDNEPSDCEECTPGQFNDAQGQSSCKLCAAGMYQDQQAQAVCKGSMCPPGKFGTKGRAISNSCTNCEQNKFQDEPGQKECKFCKPGSVSAIGFDDCRFQQFDTNLYFPGFVQTTHDFFSSGIGPIFHPPLENTTNILIDANSVKVLELFDGAIVNEIFFQSQGGLSAIKTKQKCNTECENGVVDVNTCECNCFAGYSSSSSCTTCTDVNADPDDGCESCLHNFRKNTLNECILCKFGFAGSDCSQCLENLDRSYNCQRSTCTDYKIKGLSSYDRTLLSWDAKHENELITENEYMELEGIVPQHMQNTFVFLEKSNITMFLNESHRHTMTHFSSTVGRKTIKENWWIWTIPAGTGDGNSTNFKIKSSENLNLDFASIVPIDLLYQVVCSHYDNTKYVLAPYTKHRYHRKNLKAPPCVKIDSALLQKIPLAQDYTNSIPRTIANNLLPNPGCNETYPFRLSSGSETACYAHMNGTGQTCACECAGCQAGTKCIGTKTQCGDSALNDNICAERCKNKFAWTYETHTGSCSCYDNLPFLSNTTTKHNVVSGGVFFTANQIAATTDREGGLYMIGGNLVMITAILNYLPTRGFFANAYHPHHPTWALFVFASFKFGLVWMSAKYFDIAHGNLVYKADFGNSRWSREFEFPQGLNGNDPKYEEFILQSWNGASTTKFGKNPNEPSAGDMQITKSSGDSTQNEFTINDLTIQVRRPPEISVSINKVALLDSELVSSSFAETPLVCCSRCASQQNSNFYLRDGFLCKCYNLDATAQKELSGEQSCNSENIVTELNNPFFGKPYTVLPENKNCNRRQGCVQHNNKCVETEPFEQTDEVQFGTTDSCSKVSETKYVKMYRETRSSQAQIFDAEGCSNLVWETFDKPLLNRAPSVANVVVDSDRVFVRPVEQETFTVLELTQIYATQACDEAVQLANTQKIWEAKSNVQSAQCFEVENCPIPAKSVVNDIVQLQQRQREARLRCKLLQESLAETNVILVLRQCAKGLIPPNCEFPPSSPTPALQPRLYTASPTPAAPLHKSITSNNDCTYFKLENSSFDANTARTEIKKMDRQSTLDTALTACTFNLLCSHVEEAKDKQPIEYTLFTHSGFNPAFQFDANSMVSRKASAHTYFKNITCLFAR